MLQFVTIAYDVATGSRDWVARYDGAGRNNYAFKVVAFPDGSAVFVAGGPHRRLGRAEPTLRG